MMVHNVYEITAYRYSYGVHQHSGGGFNLELFNGNRPVARVQFVTENVPVPEFTIWPDKTGADLRIKERHVPSLIDMLRNEKPVFLTIDTHLESSVFIHTELEPVGAGEEPA